MRALIEARLAQKVPAVDPRLGVLEDVHGPVPRQLLDMLQQPSRPAAVLLGLVERTEGLNVLFTERSPDLKDHPGQVSFPGGRIEAGDPGPVAAALREAEEEVGLKQETVSVAGCLDTYLTVTGFLVTPVVGFVEEGFEARPDQREVIDVFEVPLAFILDDANMQVTYRTRPDLDATFRIYEFCYEDHRVWGATAAMLRRFRDLISDGKTE